MKTRQLIKSTVRGYGFVEIVEIPYSATSTEYEVALTYIYPSHKNKSPPAKIVQSIDEALEIHKVFCDDLIRLKIMMESF